MSTRPGVPDHTETTQLQSDDQDAPRSARLRLLVIGEGVLATHPLPDAGDVVMGRSEKSGVRVDHASISRAHAVLHVGETLEIEDLGSKNGTRVRGQALESGQRVEIAPGETFEVGAMTMVVQRGAAEQQLRRLWSHGYFEGQLEEECSRAERRGSSFAVVRVHVADKVPDGKVEESLAAALQPGDVVASYGPGEYELLLTDVSPADAGEAAQRFTRLLGEGGVSARAGVALYPRDGRTAETLMARACAAVRDDAPPESPSIIVLDAAMTRLHALIERIAAGDVNVLLLGETGVGKEVVASRIHEVSPRARKAYVCLNCSALSETLFEAELFGYERGAFTGAVQAKPGLLETAQGGTVLLDEIGELSSALQAKLLRVIEEHKVQRVGSLKPRSIDVRFISATNRDLEAEAARGRFRQDLLFRLNGVSVTIPALRERASEIEPLARSFVVEACRRFHRRSEPEISTEAMALLNGYGWPGNIRELRNVMERAVLLCAESAILPEHLPTEKMEAMLKVPLSSLVAGRRIQGLERERVLQALEQCGGNQTKAARMLGISRRTLISRLEEYNLPRPRKPAP